MEINLDKKKNYILIQFLASCLLAFIIYYLSFYPSLWSNFWGSLNIPGNVVPFSDYKAHLLFLQCRELGIDINNQECTLIPNGNAQINTHPRIWTHLFGFLNFKDLLFYNISIISLLTLYFYSLIKIFSNFENKLSKIAFVFFLFSTTNFLLIERLATDLIIFLLVYFTLNFKSKIIQSILIFTGFILKYYPIFLASLLIEKKKFLAIFIMSVVAFVYLFYLKEIQLVNKNIVEMALPVAYGSRTMLKALYHLSLEYGFFINDKNLNFFRYITVFIFFVYSILLLIVGYKKYILPEVKYKHKLDKHFLAGASIYVGTYIIGANVDYRLVFLIFTIPYIVNLEKKLIKYLLLISYFVSLNSFHFLYFLNVDYVSIIFFIKASFVFICKFIILSLLTFLIGVEMKKINFLNFRK